MVPDPRSPLWMALLVALLASPALAGCVSEDAPSGTASPAGDAGGEPGSGPNGTDGRNGTSPPTGGDEADGNGTGPSDEATGNGSAEPEDEPPSHPTAFTTWGCETTFTMLEVPKRWARQRTPDGFEPITFFPLSAFAPAAPNRTVRASFLVASNHCDRITYDGPGADPAQRGNVSKLYYGVFVEPPEAYADEEKIAVYPFGFVTSEAGEAELLSAWGLPVQAGSVSLSVKADRGQARSWTLEAEAGDVSARVDLQTPGSTSAGDETSTFRFFGVDGNGTVDRAMDYEVQAPNSTQNVVAPGAMNGLVDLDAPDAPYPGPAPSPIAVTRWTPADKAAQHAELVTFEG